MIQNKQREKNLLLYGLIFCAFAAIIYLAPYTHDDWAWGCQVGIDRLKSNFVAYNGRYMGNYLVLLLTRSKLLQVITVAASLLLVCFIPSAFAGSSCALTVVFSFVMVLLMPKSIFTQTVVWTSGYSNYMPPIILTAIYFLLIKNIFSKDKPTYNKLMFIPSFILGITGCLFMEHVTLYNLAISLLIIAFVLIRFKKIYLTHISFAAGCITGTVIMFSNSAYGLIASANDAQGGYRSTALSGGLIKTLKENVEIIGKQLFLNNIVIWVIISALLTLLVISLMKKDANKKIKNFSLACLFINFISLFLIYAKSKYAYWFIFMGSKHSEIISLAFITLIMILYCLSVLALVLLCIRDVNTVMKACLILVSVVVVTVPLAVVSPVSPRCFFPQYFLLIAFCVILISYLKDSFEITETTYKTVLTSVTAIAAALFIFFSGIYLTIHSYVNKRDEYIRKQIAAGEPVIAVCAIPHSTYVYLATPTQEMWEKRFKMFYGYDTELEFKVLDYEKFDEWAKWYDTIHAEQ